MKWFGLKGSKVLHHQSPQNSRGKAANPGSPGNGCKTSVKAKVKVGFLYSTIYMVDQEQRALTISEVAVDWQEPMVLQRKCGHPQLALTDIGPAVAASKHTAPINHTRPSPRKRSSGGTTYRNSRHPLTVYYSFIDLERMKG